jgi:hypothetical protein
VTNTITDFDSISHRRALMQNEIHLISASSTKPFTNAKRLIAQGKCSYLFGRYQCWYYLEIENLEQNIDQEYLEIDIPKSIKLTKKILIPTAYSHADVVCLHVINSQSTLSVRQIARFTIK